VPTFRELGCDVAIGAWRTVAVPKAAPRPIRDRLNTVLRQRLHNPDLARDFKKVGLTVVYLDPEATGKAVMAEYAAFDMLFTSLGMNVRDRKT
jgi:putative tricarboxylic transport membrane protein